LLGTFDYYSRINSSQCFEFLKDKKIRCGPENEMIALVDIFFKITNESLDRLLYSFLKRFCEYYQYRGGTA
jgi:hypothetical protein